MVRDLALVLGGATATALAAQVAVPWQPVPFTLQTLSVYLTGIALGSKRGAASMGLYIGAAALGAPVLSGALGGLNAVTGATGGYLAGFVLSAFLLGKLAERGWDRKAWTMVAAMFLAEVIILGLGSLWLTPFVHGYANALKAGVLPFLLPEVGKMALVCAGLPLAWQFLGKRGEQ